MSVCNNEIAHRDFKVHKTAFLKTTLTLQTVKLPKALHWSLLPSETSATQKQQQSAS